MSLELNEVDQAIEVAFKEASAVETFARRLEERISQIEGARRLLPPRKYGQPIDTKAIRANLSLSTLIMRDSAELSHYLGLDPSIKRRMDEEREVQKLRAESLRMQTEALKARNQQARQDREVRQTLHRGNAVTGASEHACPTSSMFWRLVLRRAR